MRNEDADVFDTCPFDILKKHFTCMTQPHKHAIPYQNKKCYEKLKIILNKNKPEIK